MQFFRARGAVIGAAIVLVAVVGALAFAAVTRSADQTAAPAASDTGGARVGAVGTSETVPCPDSLAAGAAFAQSKAEVEGRTYSCGVVVVPETAASKSETTRVSEGFSTRSTGGSAWRSAARRSRSRKSRQITTAIRPHTVSPTTTRRAAPGRMPSAKRRPPSRRGPK